MARQYPLDRKVPADSTGAADGNGLLGLGPVDTVAHPKDHGINGAEWVGVCGVAGRRPGTVPKIPVPGRGAG